MKGLRVRLNHLAVFMATANIWGYKKDRRLYIPIAACCFSPSVLRLVGGGRYSYG